MSTEEPYAINRKVAGSSPDEVIVFFLIYLMLSAAPCSQDLLSL
jgi:hypothetical protein